MSTNSSHTTSSSKTTNQHETATRIERDSLGEVAVPVSALYGAQTQRAVDNFHISGRGMPPLFIEALALIKQAAARANQDLELLNPKVAEAISQAADKIIAGEHRDQFPVDVYQTGSGTSSNMNMNEVLAHLATEALGEAVHPNDDINLGQSSNDIIPSALHLSVALQLDRQLLPALKTLEKTLADKTAEVGQIAKTGRTHLMDAMPVTFAQELGGWQAQISSARERLQQDREELHALALGGTAVGTGINAHPDHAAKTCRYLSEATGLTLKPADNRFMALSSQDPAVSHASSLKRLAVALMKIANDLRWMNSGPLAGLGEIALPALQPGSSIMPGKVNPVIPEAVTMAAAQVMGLEQTITVAGQAGNFQLNVMLPLVGDNLLHMQSLMAHAAEHLAEKAIAGFEVREDVIQHALGRNPILVTALNPIIGYQKAAEIAKKAYAENRPIIEMAEAMTDMDRATLERLLDPAHLTDDGLSDA